MGFSCCYQKRIRTSTIYFFLFFNEFYLLQLISQCWLLPINTFNYFFNSRQIYLSGLFDCLAILTLGKNCIFTF